MSDQPVRWTPLGNLDKDSEYKLVGKGNYIDALDIIKQDDAGQVSGTIQPTQRNKHAFSLGSVQAQNKKYRVTVSGDATKSHALKFLSTKRDRRITTGTGTNGEVEFNGTIADLQSQFNLSNLPGAFQVTVSGNTMEFELVAYNYYQWYLESVGEDDVSVVCIQEAIPTDLAGPLKDIGSYDLLGDLFVFSTTQDNEPTELEAEIIGVGPIAPNPIPPPAFVFGGPLTSLTFNSEHGLQEGQWINITESNAAWLNGTFLVNSITSPIGIEIVTDTAWGASHLPHTIGQEKVFIHPTGIGEIGVAQKNNSTETWTYTRLLRSVELNFISKKSIQSYAEVDFRRRSVYYTDNYNRPRVFYYYGEYEQDGAVNDDNDYRYGSINTESSVQLPSSPVIINLEEVIATGGSIKSGTKYYLVQQVTDNGDEGPITSLLGPIVVYNEDGNNNGTTYGLEIAAEDNSVLPTRKRHKLSIKNLNGDVYSVGKIIYIEVVGGVSSANVIHEFNISGVNDYEYIHTGFEIGSEFDVGEVFAASAKSSSIVTKAKNIKEIDSRNTLSNLSTVADVDLSKWAESIRHELFYDEYPEGTLEFKGEMQESLNTLDNLGLMLNETYRMGCRVHLKGLGWTDYYWIDDIKIDANSTNTANPLDDRRDSGLTNYELTAGLIAPLSDFENDPTSRISKVMQDVNNSPSPTQYVGTNIVGLMSNGEPLGQNEGWIKYFQDSDNIYHPTAVYRVPKIKFNIDWGFTVDGLFGSLSEGVDAIEFGIGNITNSVKASGIGVLSCKMNKQAYNPTGPTPVLGLELSYITDGSIFEFPFHPYKTNLIWSENFLPNYPFIGGNRTAIEVRDVVSFYSPEHIINGNSTLSDASKLLSIGSSMTYKALTGDHSSIQGSHDYYSLFHPQGDMNTVTEIDIEETLFVSDSLPLVELNNGDKYTRMDAPDAVSTETDLSAIGQYEYRQRENDLPVFKLASDVPQYAETEIRKQQRGVNYMQVYNDESANYPRKRDTAYLKIGKTIHFPNTPNDQVVVNGGDTSTSLFYFKQRSRLRYGYFEISPLEHSSSTLGIVCQTRINVKALNPYEDDPARFLYPYSYLFPYTTMSYNWGLANPLLEETPWNFAAGSYSERVALRHWGSAPNDPSSSVYTPINNIYHSVPDYSFFIQTIQPLYPSYQYLTQSDSNTSNSRSTRITWSETKVQGSINDNYRVFLPISYKDLSPTFGEIIHHEDINGELFTIQPRKYQLQYFNTRGTLQGSNEGVEVLIGDASVLSRDGQTLSSYGTDHKWSVVKGSSQGGKDVIYWFNQENGLFMRFGADGTVVLSERNGIRSFAANNTKWTENQYTPALNYGIRSVWDDRFKEAIWTFIGVRASKGAWGTLPSNQLYSEGATVTGVTFDNYSFDGIPDVYISLSNHFPLPQSEPGVGSDWGTYWKLADKDDPEYYTVFTLAFNELSNGFSTFYSHLPKTYLKWKNKFLSSHPTERSEIYEHRYGYDKWYEYEGVWKESEPYLEGVVNPFPDQSKKFVAIQALTDNVPDRIELKTKDHESFLVATDFDPEDDAWRTPIKNDILTSQTSDPNDDTVSLIGSYMRVKFKFFNGAYNKMNNLVVKVRQRLRRTQS
jgi:hypothetical protein